MAPRNWLEMFRSTMNRSQRRRSIRKRARALDVKDLSRAVETFEQRTMLTAPEASNGSDSLHMNSTLSSSVTVSDADLDPLTVSVVDTPTHGTFSLDSSSGSFAYSPDSNYVGTDSFTFKANDGSDDSNVAIFTISVGNDAPTANDGAIYIGSNSTLRTGPRIDS